MLILKAFLRKVLFLLIIDSVFTAIAVNSGTGKTYSAVEFSEELLNNNSEEYVFITNISSYFETIKNELEKGSKGEGKIFLIKDLLIIMQRVCTDEFKDKHIIIFFDEVFTALEKTGSLRGDVLTFLSQCRKRNIIFLTTCQEWSELNITLRRYVRYQVNCNMRKIPFTHKAIVFNDINDGDTIHWDSVSNDWVSDRIQTNIRKGNADIILKYDTLETIKALSLLNRKFT